jgi:glycosyltransferase involved in cell wall biosynthesis
VQYGFARERIHLISEGIEMEPVFDLATIEKEPHPTMLALGSIRAMKRTHHVIRAFEIAKRQIPDLRLIVAGGAEGRYGKQVWRLMKRSSYAKDIEYVGRVDVAQKMEVLRRAHVLCVASVKEGWGLVVTEANSQGTPAVVYDVDGLRDSVKDGETGMVCQKNTAEEMGKQVVELLRDREKYEAMRRKGWEWSQEITFDRGYEAFQKIVHV